MILYAFLTFLICLTDHETRTLQCKNQNFQNFDISVEGDLDIIEKNSIDVNLL